MLCDLIAPIQENFHKSYHSLTDHREIEDTQMLFIILVDIAPEETTSATTHVKMNQQL